MQDARVDSPRTATYWSRDALVPGRTVNRGSPSASTQRAGNAVALSRAEYARPVGQQCAAELPRYARIRCPACRAHAVPQEIARRTFVRVPMAVMAHTICCSEERVDDSALPIARGGGDVLDSPAAAAQGPTTADTPHFWCCSSRRVGPLRAWCVHDATVGDDWRCRPGHLEGQRCRPASMVRFGGPAGRCW